MSGSQFKEKPACAVIRSAVPDVVTCSSCGAELEMWSDEDEALCRGCNMYVKRVS
ncbi:hypothetical protein [Candidatus Magnetominusculus xianensis]|uniref:Uncharacterized protein n=1 Tax=Candidatus Magnetominusculus xianensis TaxID=1748249 RepID=A0ABR5SGP7_9BACT|nr:hypothetical protein [Candidatus Magnetominusculus xianensis]KWT79624.1 hypothetical protein ASN18_2721 [Candidatus Magnetominusculus xianensis]MBF0403838.1 hypothetical protein [Nitrospirota bacterium]